MRAGQEIINCAKCNEQVIRPRHRKNKYCSQTCAQEARITTTPCKQCGVIVQTRKYKTIQQNGVFCSRACFGTYRKTLPPPKCLQCNKLFNRNRYVKYCSEPCRRIVERQRSLTPEQQAEHRYFARIKKVYGLSRNDWQVLYDLHDGACHICFEKPTLDKRLIPLDVEHDHKTLKVRGMACSYCNKLLGNARDSVEILKSAIRYIERANAEKVS